MSLLLQFYVTGIEGEVCLTVSYGLLTDRPRFVVLPIEHVGIRETMIDLSESFHTATVERIAF